MKTTLFIAGLAMTLMSPLGLAAQKLSDAKEIPMVNIERSIESPIVNVSGSYVITRTCSGCKPQQFDINPGAAFIKDNVQLTADMVQKLNGKAATVFLDSNTDKVTRVVYFSVGEN